MKRQVSSVVRRVIRFMMRSDLLWEADRQLHEICCRQRHSIMRKRARREFAAHIERGEILSGPFKGMKYAEEVTITFDGQVGFDLMDTDRVMICKSEEKLKLIKFPNQDYFDILREKLKWGESSYNNENQ